MTTVFEGEELRAGDPLVLQFPQFKRHNLVLFTVKDSRWNMHTVQVGTAVLIPEGVARGDRSDAGGRKGKIAEPVFDRYGGYKAVSG